MGFRFQTALQSAPFYWSEVASLVYSAPPSLIRQDEHAASAREQHRSRWAEAMFFLYCPPKLPDGTGFIILSSFQDFSADQAPWRHHGKEHLAWKSMPGVLIPSQLYLGELVMSFVVSRPWFHLPLIERVRGGELGEGRLGT